MIIQHKPNLILEALAYLGRRASNKTWDQMEQRIQQRKVLPSPALCQALELLKALTHQLTGWPLPRKRKSRRCLATWRASPTTPSAPAPPPSSSSTPCWTDFRGIGRPSPQLVDGLDPGRGGLGHCQYL